MPNEKITVVLVHGAWGGMRQLESCCPGAIRKLAWRLFAPPFHLQVLPMNVNALNRALARIEGELVLVGHAYARCCDRSNEE
jgi:hypothetical protein